MAVVLKASIIDESLEAILKRLKNKEITVEVQTFSETVNHIRRRKRSFRFTGELIRITDFGFFLNENGFVEGIEKVDGVFKKIKVQPRKEGYIEGYIPFKQAVEFKECGAKEPIEAYRRQLIAVYVGDEKVYPIIP